MKPTGLEVFQDLIITGAPESLDAFRTNLSRAVVAPWSHDLDGEQRLARVVGRSAVVMAFRRAPVGDVPGGILSLWGEGSELKVVNIVPTEVGELGISTYNLLLQDFATRFVAPATEGLELQVELTKPRQSLDDWMPARAAKALRAFSAAANHSSGSSHPLDRARWYDFLIKAHASANDLDADRLARWLIEEGEWGDDAAYDLASEFEFAMGLLSHDERP